MTKRKTPYSMEVSLLVFSLVREILAFQFPFYGQKLTLTKIFIAWQLGFVLSLHWKIPWQTDNFNKIFTAPFYQQIFPEVGIWGSFSWPTTLWPQNIFHWRKKNRHRQKRLFHHDYACWFHVPDTKSNSTKKLLPLPTNKWAT